MGPETPSSVSETVPTVGLNAPSPIGGLTPEMNGILGRVLGESREAESKIGRPIGDSNLDNLIMTINQIFGSGPGIMPGMDPSAAMQQILMRMFYGA